MLFGDGAASQQRHWEKKRHAQWIPPATSANQVLGVNSLVEQV